MNEEVRFLINGMTIAGVLFLLSMIVSAILYRNKFNKEKSK